MESQVKIIALMGSFEAQLWLSGEVLVALV